MKSLIDSNKIKIKMISVGLLENNVYLIESKDEKAIVDPSCEVDKIIDLAGSTDISKILITHYHWDHIRAGAQLVNKTGAKTYASKTDSPFIQNPENAPLYRKTEGFSIDNKLSDGDQITIGSTTWKIIETPGHSPGSICFYSTDDQPILISGDTLFQGSCGRIDFEDGNAAAMKSSLQKLTNLDPNTIVLPGHGSCTTIKDELSWINQIEKYL